MNAEINKNYPNFIDLHNMCSHYNGVCSDCELNGRCLLQSGINYIDWSKNQIKETNKIINNWISKNYTDYKTFFYKKIKKAFPNISDSIIKNILDNTCPNDIFANDILNGIENKCLYCQEERQGKSRNNLDCWNKKIYIGKEFDDDVE